MAEYIEREALKAKFMEHYSSEYAAALVLALIDNQPTVDVAEVRHGKWVEVVGMAPPELHGLHFCSICKEFALQKRHKECLSDYCPNCGAKMGDGE